MSAFPPVPGGNTTQDQISANSVIQIVQLAKQYRLTASLAGFQEGSRHTSTQMQNVTLHAPSDFSVNTREEPMFAVFATPAAMDAH